VVDSPPLQAVTDAAVLAARLDGALLVIHSGRTRRGAVRQAREALDRVGARILGATLNRVTERATGAYYYRYEYGSDSSRQLQSRDPARSQSR
jgi:Mrp family chromosome partitioning ATPase